MARRSGEIASTVNVTTYVHMYAVSIIQTANWPCDCKVVVEIMTA